MHNVCKFCGEIVIMIQCSQRVLVDPNKGTIEMIFRSSRIDLGLLATFRICSRAYHLNKTFRVFQAQFGLEPGSLTVTCSNVIEQGKERAVPASETCKGSSGKCQLCYAHSPTSTSEPPIICITRMCQYHLLLFAFYILQN